MTAAELIQQARRLAGLSQQELAGRSGVRQPNIAAYESGRRVPSQAMLDRLAAARPRPSVLLARYRDEIIRLAARTEPATSGRSVPSRAVRTPRTATSTCWCRSGQMRRCSTRPG